MNTTILAFILVLASIIIWATHPVAISLTLIIFSSLIITLIHLNTAASWFPLIFYLLFIGGIIVIFLILSSLSPNQPINNKPNHNTLAVILVATPLLINPLESTSLAPSQSVLNSKIPLSESSAFLFITLLILIYFTVLSSLILETESSLRSE